MAALMSLTVLILSIINLSQADRYIESIAANVADTHHKASTHKHEHFMPLVAFQCGYRNKFMNQIGEWQNDPSSAATCLHGKFDILKYCKRIYPDENITNIIEYSHVSRFYNWCKEDGSDCHSKFTVRPFRCLAGEFITESLQVPSKCHFSHIAGRDKCNDYNNWSGVAEKQCENKVVEGTRNTMHLHSFAILEPCGVDMFRGVEFVCCPKGLEENSKNVIDLENDSDDDDDDDDYSGEEDDDEEEADAATTKSSTQDPYFKDSQTLDEHERFREAIERLEKNHRKRVTKVITQWSELFERYNKMKDKDPKGAESYKREMTAKFRKTVASLEDENREQRRQIEELHNERVQQNLNEKKRQATHDYRAALAVHVSQNNKETVLRTLKAYIRAEEKDRTHMLNRYRHLLRSDPDSAVKFEPVLLHRLRYIDLRINGTLAMLRDFPSLEKEIRPVAEKFWKNYRHENTPEGAERVDNSNRNLPEDERNERLIKFYKKTYEKIQNDNLSELKFVEPIDTVKKTTAMPTTASGSKRKSSIVALKDVLSEKNVDDSDEDQFEDEDDFPSGSSSSSKFSKTETSEKKQSDIHIEFLKGTDMKSKEEKPLTLIKVPIKTKTKEQEDDDDEDDSDEAASVIVESNSKMDIVIEPKIMETKTSFSDVETDLSEERERSYIRKLIGQTNILIGLMAIILMLVFLVVRRRNRRRGFIEVEIRNPDDKHVSSMQINGYENPTYSFYEAKP